MKNITRFEKDDETDPWPPPTPVDIEKQKYSAGSNVRLRASNVLDGHFGAAATFDSSWVYSKVIKVHTLKNSFCPPTGFGQKSQGMKHVKLKVNIRTGLKCVEKLHS